MKNNLTDLPTSPITVKNKNRVIREIRAKKQKVTKVPTSPIKHMIDIVCGICGKSTKTEFGDYEYVELIGWLIKE